MPRTDLWTEPEVEILRSLAFRGYRVNDVVEELARNGYSRTYGAVKRKVNAIRHSDPSPNGSAEPEEKVPLHSAVETIEHLRREATLGITRWHEHNPFVEVEHHKKILSLSDIHIPFFNDKALSSALSSHSDADVVVINGDLLEVDMASRFPRTKTVLLKYEYKLALKWIAELAEMFSRVVIVSGNHEERLDRYFASKVDPGINFMVEGDILWRISEGHGFDEEGHWEKKYDFDNVSYSRGMTRWFVQIGQAIFCHPWRTSSLTIKSVENAHQWFSSRGFSYQSIIMGHTHRLGQAVVDGKLLIEQGCLCVPLDYAARADIKYKPTTAGYAVVHLDKSGNVDFNASKPVFCGTASTTPCHSMSIEEV